MHAQYVSKQTCLVPQCSIDVRMCRQDFKACLQDTLCSIYREQKQNSLPPKVLRMNQKIIIIFKKDYIYIFVSPLISKMHTAQWFLFNQAGVSLRNTGVIIAFIQLSFNSYTVIIIITNIYRRKKLEEEHV